MKKALIVFGTMAFALTAPTISAEPVSTPAATAAQPTADAAVAVKRYVYNTVALTLDSIADGIAASDGTAISQTKITIQALKAALDLPVDSLPAEHQTYLREAYAASKPFIEEMEALLNQVEAGSISEEDSEAKLEELAAKAKEKQEEIEAKYPESAKLLGQDATQRLTMELMPQLQMLAMSRIEEYLAQHPEDAGNEAKLMAASFRICAQILREMAAAL